VLAQLHEKYPEDVRLVYRHFPLPSHSLSVPAAVAAEAAGKQGKFWEMSEHIFATQSDWAAMTADQFNSWVVEQASSLGLDITQFQNDLKSQEILDKVKAAQQNGIDSGIPGTPFLLINGLRYEGPRDLANLEAILKLFVLANRQFTYCPPMQIDPQKQYIATIKTEKGDFKIQLYPDKAPMAVNSFVFLARNGWYDNITFHQVVAGLGAQTGDPSGSGMGGPGYTFDDEISDLTYDEAGVVSMVNAGPGSNGSQFFITFGPEHQLDGKYTIFGKVIEGMNVVEKIDPRDPQTASGPGNKIYTITIEEK